MRASYYIDVVTKGTRKPLLTIPVPWPFYKLIWTRRRMERSKR